MPTKTYAGKEVEINDEGFLVNPDDWIPEMAQEIANES